MNELYDSHNIFAQILRGEKPCFRLYEDSNVLSFMDIMPRTEGHILVIPKKPVRGLLDMPPEEWGPFMQRVQYIGAHLVKALGAEGLTLQQFNETAGGQVVFHMHIHLLPRWTNRPLQPAGVPAPQEALEKTAQKIREGLKPFAP